MHDLRPLANPYSLKNFIFEATREPLASKVILKFHHSQTEALREKYALNFYDGNGSVRLLESNIEDAVLLRSYAHPSKHCNYFPKQDQKSAALDANVIKKLHRTKPTHDLKAIFPSIEDLLVGLKEHNVVPSKHIEQASLIGEGLLKSNGETFLLHGDLHHDNILLDDLGQPISIDPKGVIGELAYEVGAFMRNPMPRIIETPDFTQIFSARLEIFSNHLDLDKDRIALWSYVQSVLAACWAVEDNQEWCHWVRCAELISAQSPIDRMIVDSDQTDGYKIIGKINDNDE